MPRLTTSIPEITVYISSPGDVADERQIVKHAIQEINLDPAWQNRCSLKSLAYEDGHVPSQMGKSAQRVVDDYMRKASEADIVVCLFCNRMGTPTVDERTGKQYLSGSHYEFDSAYQAFKNGGEVSPRILLFLGKRDFPDDASDEDLEQFIAARKFKEHIRTCTEYDGLYFEYRDLYKLEGLVRDHLKRHLHQMLGAPVSFEAPPATPAAPARVRAYLRQLAESFRWLELQGIREAGALRIELEKVYVALKAEPESDYERQQEANLHDIEVQDAAGVDSLGAIDPATLQRFDAALIRQTYRPSREEAKRATVTVVRTLADAFRQHRRMVIRGGPGSGKTTLGRWMALQLARALSRQLDCGTPQRVAVPIAQVDPDDRRAGGELLDLGPARLPIFLRLAHFARELAERERQQNPSLALIDYLGRDPDSCGLADGLSPDARNAMFRAQLENGKAVAILDGLDELSEANRREVVLKIQDFIETYTTPDDMGATEGLPWEIGGNQVVVTSRYVGYKYSPVRAGCAHFGIQAMQRPAVERFARAWTDAVNAELGAEGYPPLVAERLIGEIYNQARPTVRELATNPLLVTILATVYWRDGRLPDQRAGVYDRVVENLLEIWLRRQECRAHHLTREELLAALQPLAAEMQENTSNGLISLDRIGELVEGPLAHLRNLEPDDPRFGRVRNALLNTIRSHVGLLAEQSSDNFAFFHRTFQEFLAARHLLAHRPTAAEKLGDRMDDPLWREPLLLALGFAMIDGGWGPDTRCRLLTEFLATDGPEALIPRAAMLLVTALPDLRDVPATVVSQTVTRLLTSYSISQDQGHAGVLREQIEQAFERLREGRQVDPVARQLAECLRRPGSGRDLAGATASILRRINWFTTELVEALLLAVHRDRADLDWPVHRALLAALGQRPAALPWLTPAPVLNVARLLGSHLPMRKLLESTPELVALVRGDADWLCLLVALYGGLGHFEWLERTAQRQRRAPSAPAPVPIPPDEPELEASPPIPAVEFTPQDIVHDLADSDLSRLIQRHLGARSAARDLADTLRQRWEEGRGTAGGAEALVGLAALGEDILPMLRTALAEPARQPATQAVLARLSWLRCLLREPLSRTTEDAARTLPDGIPEHHQLDLLRVALMARAASAGTPLPVSDTIPELRYVAASTPAVQEALEAEYWSYAFSGTAREEGESSLASVASRVTQPFDRLLRSWSRLPAARNHRGADRFPWPQPILAPRADSTIEQYLATLDAMMSVPREHHPTAGYVLGRCRPLLEEHPDLAWETLAVCWYHGREFSGGYRRAARGGPLHNPPPGCLLPDELDDDIQPPTHSELFRQVSRIADPYLRFRAIWKFLGAVVGEGQAVEVDALGLVEQIRDPHDRARALEWILMAISSADVGLLNYIGQFEVMVRPVSRITDPENRARAACRLAFFTSEHLERLLHDAVEAVREIADPGRCAETIDEIRSVWGRTAGVSEALDAIAARIPDSWKREKALGRFSRLVRAYRHQFAAEPLAWRLPLTALPSAPVFRQPRPAGVLPWELVYLDATAAEVESLGVAPVGASAHWDRLLSAERPAAVSALVEAGLEAGLPVTAREVSILDRVVQAGQAADLDALWPYLDCPDPSALGTVARWTSRRDRAGQWSALVQAQGGRLHAEIVASVIDLLAGSTDRMKLRAALALHGPTPYTRNPERRWSIRRIGSRPVDVLARCAIQDTYPPAVQTAMNWARSDIHHDDRPALEAWLQQAASGEPAGPAHWVLRSLQSVQGDLVPLLVSALRTGSPRLQRSLLFGLASLAYCSETFKSRAGQIHTAIAAVPPDIRAGIRVLPKGTKTLLAVAEEVVRSARPGDRLAQARQSLEAEQQWLDEASLADSETCLARLKLIGSQLYISIGDTRLGISSYWSATDNAAAPLAENIEVLQLLLSWLASADVTGGADGYAHHLLTVTESVARLSPNAFAGHAAPGFWEPILTDWAQYGEHWTARLAAVRLLGRLRRVTERVARALRSAMNDVSFVQQAAYECVSEFRYIEGDLLPELLPLIDDPSAAVAAATSQLLVGIAQSELNSADRRRILRSLQQAAARPSAVRPVYLMEEGGGSMSIRYVDRLDRIMYGAIFEISGL